MVSWSAETVEIQLPSVDTGITYYMLAFKDKIMLIKAVCVRVCRCVCVCLCVSLCNESTIRVIENFKSQK